MSCLLPKMHIPVPLFLPQGPLYWVDTADSQPCIGKARSHCTDTAQLPPVTQWPTYAI